MISPLKPANEHSRLKALKSYDLLDTLPEDAYSTIVELAAHICQTPISLVTLIDADRNFLKARKGVDMSEGPRHTSFCAHAILSTEDVFVIEDARKDPRFKRNPLIKSHNTIFYAGVPLRTDDGYALGTLCVYDHTPRSLEEAQKKALVGLAHQVILLFEARKRNLEIEKSKLEITKRNERLNDFANLVAHDLKSPLATIESLIQLLHLEYPQENYTELSQYLDLLSRSAQGLREYIEGLLKYYKTDQLLIDRGDVTLEELIQRVRRIYPENRVHISIKNNVDFTTIAKVAVEQIITNLIDNSIKYNSNEVPKIEIHAEVTSDCYIISITDDGIGIPERQKEEIFELFKTTRNKDRNGEHGSGMGLATVKKLVKSLGGTIGVRDAFPSGSIFTFTIRRE